MASGETSSNADRLLEQVTLDQDEWEYEYSTTETETYYLSIELSHPELRGPVKTPNPGRGQYHKQWHESTNAVQAKAVTESAKAKPNQPTQHEDETMYDQDAPGEVDDTMIDPQLRAHIPAMQLQAKGNSATRERDDADEVAAEDNTKEQQTDEDDAAHDGTQEPTADDPEPETAHDIQILDLHSDTPYISYRGKVFEGEWAEVMGTELILAQHDQNDDLPVLRQLAQGVDLFAASTSRVITKEKIPKLKEIEDDDLADIKDEWNIKVPAGKDRSGDRARQARFLENLMALKKKKGHVDQVTVFANSAAEQDFADDANPDQKPQKKKKKATERRERTQPPHRAGSQSSNPFAGRRGGNGRAPRRGRGLIDSLSAVSRPTPRTLDEMNRNVDGGSGSSAGAASDQEPSR